MGNIGSEMSVDFDVDFLHDEIRRVYTKYVEEVDESRVYNAAVKLKAILDSIEDPKYDVPPARLIRQVPTHEMNVNRLKECYEARFRKRYQNPDSDKLVVTDVWAEMDEKRECFLFKEKPEGAPAKRFTSRPITHDEFVFRQTDWHTLKGNICEEYIIAQLNYCRFRCPGCMSQGMLGMCDGNMGFCDAMCMSCGALFEIKTRNDKKMDGMYRNGMIAGNYVSLEALFHRGCRIWMVAVSKDTGHVRISEINRFCMEGKARYLYDVQEDVGVTEPCTYINCRWKLLNIRIPSIDEVFTPEVCDRIYADAKKEIDKIKIPVPPSAPHPSTL